MTTRRRVAAEFLGTMLLLAVVIGSGIMGERLAGGNVAIALLGNTIATGAGLVVLIHMFGPVSGAHFNPAVTLAALIGRGIGRRTALLYLPAQLMGAVFGAWLARLAFNEALMIRRRSRTDTVPLDRIDASGLAAPASDTEQLDAVQTRQLLEQAVDSLPEVFRTVFVLRVVEQLSGVETAACLGINETTVRTRLFRAQQRLRTDLARRLRAERANVFEFDTDRCDRIVARVLERMSA